MFVLNQAEQAQVSGGATREEVDAYVAQLMACDSVDALEAVIADRPAGWELGLTIYELGTDPWAFNWDTIALHD